MTIRFAFIRFPGLLGPVEVVGQQRFGHLQAVHLANTRDVGGDGPLDDGPLWSECVRPGPCSAGVGNPSSGLAHPGPEQVGENVTSIATF